MVKLEALVALRRGGVNNRCEPAVLFAVYSRGVGAVLKPADLHSITDGCRRNGVRVNHFQQSIGQFRNGLRGAIVDGKKMVTEALSHEGLEGLAPVINTCRGTSLGGITHQSHPPRRAAAEEHSPLHRR